MVFQYLKNWQEDFWFQIVFLFRYFIEDIAERKAECPHPKSFYEQFSWGDGPLVLYAFRVSTPRRRGLYHLYCSHDSRNFGTLVNARFIERDFQQQPKVRWFCHVTSRIS
jgi:hypothetical protein